MVGSGAPQSGARIETLLPEDLFGGRTPNLDLVTMPDSLSFYAFQRKEMAKSSSPALPPMSHTLCQVNLRTLLSLLQCALLPVNSAARKRQFAL